jgi:hypothetical protein
VLSGAAKQDTQTRRAAGSLEYAEAQREMKGAKYVLEIHDDQPLNRLAMAGEEKNPEIEGLPKKLMADLLAL